MSHIFIKRKDTENHFDITDVKIRVDSAASLSDLIESFELYLKACGFVFNGKLEFVDDNYEKVTEHIDEDEDTFNIG